MASYSDAELEALKLLRSAFSWKVSLDQRSGVWVATYADERIGRYSPLGLFGALTLAASTCRDNYLVKGTHAPIDTEQEDSMACDCCKERLEQLAAVLHEGDAQILAELSAVDHNVAELAALMRPQIPPK